MKEGHHHDGFGMEQNGDSSPGNFEGINCQYTQRNKLDSAAWRKGDASAVSGDSPGNAILLMDEKTPLLKLRTQRSSDERKARFAIIASLAVNFCLFLTKLVAMIISRSLSVLASLLDSVLDLTAQCVIWYTHRQSSHRDPNYPAGKSRLSPIGIIFLAILMFGGAVEVIHESTGTLYGVYLTRKIPRIDFNAIVISSLIGVIGIKIVLWWYCALVKDSPDVQALAADHRNDVFSNIVALACGLIAYQQPTLWYVDPIGAITISLYIGWSWFVTGRDNMSKLVGREADAEIISLIYEKIESFSVNHPEGEIDWLRAYYLGHNVVVEVELVLPANTPLQNSHDAALVLQQQIEDLSEVERCYVHVDYTHRNYDEHKYHSFPFSSFETVV